MPTYFKINKLLPGTFEWQIRRLLKDFKITGALKVVEFSCVGFTPGCRLLSDFSGMRSYGNEIEIISEEDFRNANPEVSGV